MFPLLGRLGGSKVPTGLKSVEISLAFGRIFVAL
jgi:hypothetical protein